ncbi:hypothetical protein SAMN05443633_101473 [Chryseobacterium arachidis]|uniref:Uncharacterized protein n=1 Tax=Chryseobacterium arachidis TaxID=1416778 RepID=A0A1M4UD44_9FLAO|nr:hypothetical protein SAMN05443633_101473 [Chryseobacterium arachidis]
MSSLLLEKIESIKILDFDYYERNKLINVYYSIS